jgi:hypothetical protein
MKECANGWLKLFVVQVSKRKEEQKYIHWREGIFNSDSSVLMLIMKCQLQVWRLLDLALSVLQATLSKSRNVVVSTREKSR